MSTVFSVGIATPAFAGRGFNVMPLIRRIAQELEENPFFKKIGERIGILMFRYLFQYMGDWHFWSIIILVLVALGILSAFSSES